MLNGLCLQLKNAIFGCQQAVWIEIAERDRVILGEVCVGEIVACANANVKVIRRDVPFEEGKLDSAG